MVIFVLLLGGVINGTVTRCSMQKDLKVSHQNESEIQKKQVEIIERNNRVDSVDAAMDSINNWFNEKK